MKKRFGVGAMIIISFSPFVSAQECVYEPVVPTLTGEQNIALKDMHEELSHVIDYFDHEYLVVDMSRYTCEHCVNFALAHNNDQDFIARTSGSGSCDFLTLVETGTLVQWLQKIGGPASYIGSRSREVVGDIEFFLNIPTLYGGKEVTALPTVFIINRFGELIVQNQGDELPGVFYDLCLPNSCSGEEGADNTKGKQSEEGDSCGCGGGNGDGGNGDGGNGDGGNGDGGNGDGGNGDGGNGDGGNGDGGNGDGWNGDGGDGDGGLNGTKPEPPKPIDEKRKDVDRDPKVEKLRIALPYEAQPDVIAGNEGYIDSQNSKTSVYRLIKTITEWLWIGVIVLLLAAIIYAGYLLITSMGNADKLNKANNILFYSGIALGVALFAYALVSIIVNIL